MTMGEDVRLASVIGESKSKISGGGEMEKGRSAHGIKWSTFFDSGQKISVVDLRSADLISSTMAPKGKKRGWVGRTTGEANAEAKKRAAQRARRRIVRVCE
jgi:hypothetical protein